MNGHERRKLVGRWLNRLRFKTIWMLYHYGDMSTAEFRNWCYIMSGDIRRELKFEDGRNWKAVFDEGWEVLNVYSGHYPTAYNHMIKMIYIDW